MNHSVVLRYMSLKCARKNKTRKSVNNLPEYSLKSVCVVVPSRKTGSFNRIVVVEIRMVDPRMDTSFFHQLFDWLEVFCNFI